MRPKKKISQSDIADILGISNVSVSNALAGRKGVSRELIEKVRRTALEMGYSEAGSAGASAGMIVAIVSDAWTEKENRLLESSVREKGFRVEFCALKDVLGGLCADQWKASECCGVLVPDPLPTGVLQLLNETIDKPTLGVGFFDCHVPIDYVMDDGFHGAQTAVRYLRERGYERILYVMPEEKHSQDEVRTRMRDDRLLGFRCGIYLQKIGEGEEIEEAPAFELGSEQNILTLGDVKRHFDTESPKDKGQWPEAPKSPPPAFFCGDRTTAEALMSVLVKNGVQVPEDAAVIGYDAGEEGSEDGPNGENPDKSRLKKGGRARTDFGTITEYRNDRKNLLDHCCELLHQKAEGKAGARGIHMVSGRISEGDTVKWQNR